MSRVGRHSWLSLSLAIGVSLAIAGTALAASWTTPLALTSSGNAWNGTIATLSATSAIAVHRNGTKIQTRRTIDGGTTWRAAALVSRRGSLPDIAGSGLAVDVVWTQHGVVHYRRSIDGGASYQPVIELGSVRVCPGGVVGCVPAPGAQVAHGPGNVVVVAWLDDRSDANIVYARVSADAGASFGPARMVNRDESGLLTFSGPDVAVGRNGVIHVAYLKHWAASMSIEVRRSTNGGAAWSAPIDIGPAIDTNIWEGPGNCQPSITAVRTHAYLAWCFGYYDEQADQDRYGIAYTRTIDNGKTWSQLFSHLTPTEDYDAPHIDLRGGVVRVAYGHYDNGTYEVLYRQSTDGLTWSAAELVVMGDNAFPGGVAYFGGKAFVLFYDGNARVTTRNP